MRKKNKAVRSKKRIIWLLTVAFCIVCSLPAQEEIPRVYYQKYDSDSSLKLYVNQKSSSLSYVPTEGDEAFNYSPNSKIKVGLGASWKSLAISWSYGMDLSGNDVKGKATSTDLSFNYYGSKFIFEASAQKYTGFYLVEEIEFLYNPGTYKVFRPDIELLKYVLFGQYIFNNHKFSYRAPFGQRERQILSAGSWQVGFGAYFTDAKADSTFNPADIMYSPQHLQNLQIGPNVGYTYTWVKNRFFLTVSLSAGVNVGILYNNEVKQPREVTPAVYPRIYTGYNANHWSVNLSYTNNQIFIASVENAQIGMSMGHFEIALVRRFHLKFRPKFFEKVPDNLLRFTGLE